MTNLRTINNPALLFISTVTLFSTLAQTFSVILSMLKLERSVIDPIRNAALCVKSTRDSRLEPWVCQSLVLYPWTYLIFLNFSFIVCTLDIIIILTSQCLYMLITGETRVIHIWPGSLFRR